MSEDIEIINQNTRIEKIKNFFINNYKNLSIAWVGDYNNVLRSFIHLQNIYNFKLNVVVPNQIFKYYKNTNYVNECK